MFGAPDVVLLVGGVLVPHVTHLAVQRRVFIPLLQACHHVAFVGEERIKTPGEGNECGRGEAANVLRWGLNGVGHENKAVHVTH